MTSRLKRFFARFRGSSLQRGDYIRESERPVENTDALTAEQSSGGHTFPPGYVKSYDEGRPRK
jgi:hypothetical protein